MSHSRTKPAEHERRDRRAALDVLLARAQRGRLSRAEATALAEYVREEQRAADECRRSLTGTTRALERNRQAADNAVREMEQRALDAEEQLTAYRSVLGPRPLDTVRAAEQRLARIRNMADAWERRLPAAIRTATAADAIRRAANGDDSPVMFEVTAASADDQAEQWRPLAVRRRERAEEALAERDRLGAAWRSARDRARRKDRDARTNGADCRAEYERARRLEAELAEERATFASLAESHAEALTRAERATVTARRAEQALDRVRQADSLGAALAAVAEHDGLTPQAAAAHAAITDRADTIEARLAEQAREHAVELATAHRTTRASEQALARIRAARTWGEVWTTLGMYYGLPPEECGQQARARRTEAELAAEHRGDGWRRHALAADARADRHLAAWRNAARRAREHAVEEQRVRGWCGHWADRARIAEARVVELEPIPYQLADLDPVEHAPAAEQ